jgi:hypothetical protein
VPQDVEVINNGSVPVAIGGIVILPGPGSAGQFTIQANNCNGTLAVGESCIIDVVFGSTGTTAAGPKTASLRVTGSGVNQTITLTGTTTVATVTFSAPVPLLTTAPATTLTKTGTITVSNTPPLAGPGALYPGAFVLTAAPTIQRVGGGGGGTFTITPGGTCVLGATVASGTSCTIIVQYAFPPAGGSLNNATAHVTINDVGALTTTQTSPNFTAN